MKLNVTLPFSMEQNVTTGLLAIPSVRGKKDAIVSQFCGLSCGELINEAAFQANVRFMMFKSMLV